MLTPDSKIFVSGHRGLAGSAICRALKAKGYHNLLQRTRTELNLEETENVFDFFAEEKPDVVVLAAAKVGGILANNNYPAEYIFNNLQVQNNCIEASRLSKVKKLLFLGSSCIYPKYAPQPMREEHLLTGELEPTNRPYAIAKIAGIEMCRSYRRQYGCNFISGMPTNLYGDNDNFHLENSHVMPGLIHRFHLAKANGVEKIVIWGTGKPFREFLHTDDLGKACVFLLENYNEIEIVNIGTGKDVTIKDLAYMIAKVVGFEGKIEFDPSKPDGAPRKLLDVSKINDMGWEAKYNLKEGIQKAYDWFLANQDTFRS